MSDNFLGSTSSFLSDGFFGGGQFLPQIISAGLIADYRFNQGSGTTIIDYSGNGNNAAFAAGVNAPTWVANGVHFGTDQWATSPFTTSQILSVMALIQLDASVNTYPPILGDDNDTWGFWLNTTAYGSLSSNVTQALILLAVWGPGYGSSGSNDFITSQMAAVVSQTSSVSADAFYVNNNAPQTPNATSSLAVRTGNLNIGGSSHYPSNTQVSMSGVMYRMLLYSTTLTQANIASNYLAIKAAAPAGLVLPGSNPSTGRIYAAEGDSITAGAGIGTPASYPIVMTLANTYDRTNFGIAGQTLATMNSQGFDKIKMKYAPNGVKNVVTIFGGTNDMCQGGGSSSAADTFVILQALVAKYQAQGWKVIIIPMISRTGTGFGGGTCDSLKNSYNTLIQANSWGANISVIQLNDANMGSGSAFNFFADGAYANATYFQADGTHPTATGAAAIGNAVAVYINALG